ncbi:Thymus-specific serine protease [Mortierella alpina]|nr:Thymus-specific serine protease [Mortierella alpina]
MPTPLSSRLIMTTAPRIWILVLTVSLSLTVLVLAQSTVLPEHDPPSSSWTSDTIGTLNRSYRSPFVKTFGLRHKPSMDWGMRARARNQVHWDKYWSELETGQEFDILSDLDLDPDLSDLSRNSTLSQNTTTTANGSSHLQLGADLVTQPESSNDPEPGATGTTPGLPPGDKDPGYFFTQVLDHYPDPPPAGAPAPAENTTTTFRQRYRINSQFYKPGGPLILWLPGESPLHSLFLGRGLSYELANATSGLLLALEHRFYGSSIPRFQDAPKPRSNTTSSQPVKDKRPKDDFNGMNARLGGARGRGVGGRAGVWGTASATHSYSGSSAENKTNSANGSNPSPVNGDGGEAEAEAEEGLPLDLLKYLTVDQSIEDIVNFMDNFPANHPSFFDGCKDHPPRWILTGCSYGGNLAAWTRQRHPSKVFAAFASSAPLRSTLDFFEYSTSQTDVFGEVCASQLAHARDFLDEALLMTDDFMYQMDLLDRRKAKDGKGKGEETLDEYDSVSPSFTSTTAESPHEWTREARRAAKLRVLSWFSPDFANEYAVDGEEIHAAGWIWWTVASAVQYNAVVVPPTVKPTKTVVDVLCDTMALGYKDIVLQKDKQEKTAHQHSQEGFETGGNGNSSTEEDDPLQAVRFARTLAMWFRNQQFFTPTRHEDLQPSDMDPNSVQNLAGMAWLWQTCSELGYLQTTHPSPCCCGLKSASFSADDSADDSDTFTTTRSDNDGNTAAVTGDNAAQTL